MKSNYNIQYSDTGKLVYFQVDMMELFHIDLSTPGVPTALNHAFNVSKSAVPVKTGLMLRSYTMDKISSTTVRCYFDPEKIIGKKRLGKVVKEYYPQYLVNYPSRVNWLDLVIKRFYDALMVEMEKLSKKNKNIDMDNYYLFMLLLIQAMKKKVEEEKKLKEAREKRRKELDKKREEFRQSLKKGGK